MDTYDRADWHSGADNYPPGLPREAAGTHIGMFLAWAILRDRVGDLHDADALLAVRQRRMSGREFLFEHCDGRLWPADLSDEGNAFARVYWQDGAGGIRRDGYLADYERTLGGELPDLYRVADTWQNFDALARVLDRRFEQWQRRRGVFASPGGGSNYWKIVGGGP